MSQNTGSRHRRHGQDPNRDGTGNPTGTGPGTGTHPGANACIVPLRPQEVLVGAVGRAQPGRVAIVFRQSCDRDRAVRDEAAGRVRTLW